eukprot:15446895-Alexandrium_andersonii.AAC.1
MSQRQGASRNAGRVPTFLRCPERGWPPPQKCREGGRPKPSCWSAPARSTPPRMASIRDWPRSETSRPNTDGSRSETSRPILRGDR